jgi:predicted RNA binding protein YcfA (HicA-like mRNA interferase family)
MTPKAEKLLNRARQSKAGWMPHELLMLYEAFGFRIREASGSHKYISHPKFSGLTAVVPVHAKELGKKYIADAVKNIEAAIALEKEESSDDE